MSKVQNIPEFGLKRDNEERRDGGCAVVFDPFMGEYAVGKQENGFFRLFYGGVDADEDIEQGVLREVEEEGGLYDFLKVEKIAEAWCHYYNSLKKVNRVAYSTCFLIILKSREVRPTKLEKHEKFVLHWTTAKELLDNFQSRNQGKDTDHWIYFLKKCLERLKELGYIQNL